jgi:hypothetical protein
VLQHPGGVAVHGLSANDVMIVADGGSLHSVNGSFLYPGYPTGAVGAPTAVWSVANSYYAVTDDGCVWQYVSGNLWTLAKCGVDGGTSYLGMWGNPTQSAPGQLWLVGQRNGGATLDLFSNNNVINPVWSDSTPGFLHGVGGDGANNIWAVGTAMGTGALETVQSTDTGVTWSHFETSSAGAGYALWNAGAGGWWEVGDPQNPVCSTMSVGAWSFGTIGMPNAKLRAIWGSSASDIWVVGLGGVMIHFNGASWTSMTAVTTDDLTGIWGASATDIWAVGPNVILRCQ